MLGVIIGYLAIVPGDDLNILIVRIPWINVLWLEVQAPRYQILHFRRDGIELLGRPVTV